MSLSTLVSQLSLLNVLFIGCVLVHICQVKELFSWQAVPPATDKHRDALFWSGVHSSPVNWRRRVRSRNMGLKLGPLAGLVHGHLSLDGAMAAG